MELITALGLDLKILIAQLVNFTILVLVLYKFGYKPMLNFIDDRRKKIEEGVINAEKAQSKLLELTEKEKQVIKDAKKEAFVLIEQAKNQAEDKKKDMIVKARNEIAAIIAEEKQKIKKEKDDIIAEIRKEAGVLVFEALEKIIEKKMDEREDKKFIEKIIKDLNK